MASAGRRSQSQCEIEAASIQVPLQLRAPCTQMLQMFWAIGSIIVGAVTYHYNDLNESAAYRLVSCDLPMLCVDKQTLRPSAASRTGSRSLCSGCSRLLLLSSSFSRQRVLGGS